LQAAVSYLSKDRGAPRTFKAGVSLHSHTNHSRESLDFIRIYAQKHPVMRWIFAKQEENCRRAKFSLDLDNAYWTPPLTARLAHDLEKKQIEDLDLQPWVSISDHDNIEAPMLLRVVPEIRRIPVSVEWTAPFGKAVFHLGIHNLPSARGQEIMDTLSAFTRAESHDESRLTELLAMLAEIPTVLLIFNHPLWNLNCIPDKEFKAELDRFLQVNNGFFHAFELNGLRSHHENQDAVDLATRWKQLIISGGDRHGREPNANLNLTNAQDFNEFVYEIRNERRSHILFMPQYEEPLALRFYQTFLDAIGECTDYPEGMQRWDERTFHPDATGIPTPISQLWRPKNRPPALLETILSWAQVVKQEPVRGALRALFGKGEYEVRIGSNGEQEALP
jgi:hypothetical protein